MSSHVARIKARNSNGPWIAWGARWRPAVMGDIDVMLSVYALAAMSLLRGVDYGLGDDDLSSLSVVETALPLWAWSTAFAVGGLVLFIGARLKFHGMVWLGHAMLCVLYTALAVGISIVVVGNPWFDGMRAASVLILPMVMHAILALRTGPTPIEQGEETATVITGSSDGGG